MSVNGSSTYLAAAALATDVRALCPSLFFFSFFSSDRISELFPSLSRVPASG
jgi:hypothetical protein